MSHRQINYSNNFEYKTANITDDDTPWPIWMKQFDPTSMGQAEGQIQLESETITTQVEQPIMEEQKFVKMSPKGPMKTTAQRTTQNGPKTHRKSSSVDEGLCDAVEPREYRAASINYFSFSYFLYFCAEFVGRLWISLRLHG